MLVTWLQAITPIGTVCNTEQRPQSILCYNYLLEYLRNACFLINGTRRTCFGLLQLITFYVGIFPSALGTSYSLHTHKHAHNISSFTPLWALLHNRLHTYIHTRMSHRSSIGREQSGTDTQWNSWGYHGYRLWRNNYHSRGPSTCPVLQVNQ